MPLHLGNSASLQTHLSDPSVNRILRWPDVQKRIGLSKSYVYHLISLGTFPKPIKLGPRASGWIESEINEWIEQRIAESREKGGLA